MFSKCILDNMHILILQLIIALIFRVDWTRVQVQRTVLLLVLIFSLTLNYFRSLVSGKEEI